MAQPHTLAMSKAAPTILLLGAAAICVAWITNRPGVSHPPDSAPGRTARRGKFGDYVVAGRSVTVNSSQTSLYALCREAPGLPYFLDHVSNVQNSGSGRWTWRLHGPAGTEARIEADFVEERPGEVLAWKSTDASEIEAQGKITFSNAPGGRGTRVEATVSYIPPLGQPGHWVAQLTGRDPATLARHALKRLKMVAEAGEIATAANRKEA